MIKEKRASQVSWILLGLLIAFGFLQVIYFIFHLPARGDEGFSFIECSGISLWQLMLNIKHGADNSYIYSAFLWTSFKVLGHTLEVQRFLSLIIEVAGCILFYRLSRRIFQDELVAAITTSVLAFSDLGIFLAYDGRFYSLLFFFSILLVCQILSERGVDWKSFLITVLILLGGVLTSLNFLLLPVFLTFSFLLFGLRRQAISVILPTGLVFVVYFFLFRIQFFFNNQFWLLNRLNSVTPSTFFGELIDSVVRWMPVAILPRFSSIISFSAAISLVTWLTIYFFRFRKELSDRDKLIVSIAFTGCFIPLCLVFMYFVYPTYILWPVRYFTPVFFLGYIGLGLFLSRVSVRSRFGIVVTLFVFIVSGIISRLWINNSNNESGIMSVAGRFQESGKHELVIVESDKNPVEFALYSALYCRYPALRNNLIYLFNSTPDRSFYFSNLAKMYPWVRFYPKGTEKEYHNAFVISNVHTGFKRYETKVIP